MGADIVQRTNENLQYYFDKSNEPILVINSGNSISVETERADGMYLSRQNSVFRDHDHVMQVRSNPVTGPICINVAMPGDQLAVKILDITCGDDGSEGYFTYVPSQGLFANLR